MISTVAPRLDNDSHALPALKRRPRIKPSLRDEEKIRAMRKNVGNDKDVILSHVFRGVVDVVIEDALKQ